MRALLLALILLAAPAGAAELKLSTWNLDWLTTRAPDDPALPRELPRREPGDWRLLAGPELEAWVGDAMVLTDDHAPVDQLLTPYPTPERSG